MLIGSAAVSSGAAGRSAGGARDRGVLAHLREPDDEDVLAGQPFTDRCRGRRPGGRAGGGESLLDIALPVMNDLQSATTETIHRAAPDGDLLVLVERLGTSHRLRDAAARISGALGGAPWCTGRPGQRPSHQTTMSMNDNAVTRQRPCRSRAFAVVRRQGFEPRTR